MTGEFEVPVWLAVVALLAVVLLTIAVVALLASVRRTRERTDRMLDSAAADAEELRSALAAIQEQLPRPGSAPSGGDEREYVITALGEQPTGVAQPARTVPAPVFADIVMRESVIRTASLAAGLRRALSPQVRHRIRFEMKREVKRSRKQRRADLKVARREWEARQRDRAEVA